MPSSSAYIAAIAAFSAWRACSAAAPGVNERHPAVRSGGVQHPAVRSGGVQHPAVRERSTRAREPNPP
eukprot:2178403-Prymnesium_polylepis.1